MAIATPISIPMASIASRPHLLLKALRVVPAAATAGKSVKAVALPKVTAAKTDLAALFQTLIANLQPAIEPPAPKHPGAAAADTRPRSPLAETVELPILRPHVEARVLASAANDPKPPIADSAAKLASPVEAIVPAAPAVPEPVLAVVALDANVPVAPTTIEHGVLPEPALASVALPPLISLPAFTAELRPRGAASAVEPAPQPPLESPAANVMPEPTRAEHTLDPAPKPAPEVPRTNAFHPAWAISDVPLVDQPPPSAPERVVLPPEPQSIPAMKLPPAVPAIVPPKAESVRAETSPPPPPREVAPSPGAPERREAVPEPAEAPHPAVRSVVEVSNLPIEPRRAEAPKPEPPPSRAIAAASEIRPRELHPEAVARPAEAESRPAAAASEPPAPDAVVERAALHTSTSGNAIELLLRAEHLGRVAVRLIERAGVIEVAVRSDSQPLRTLLAESLPSLVHTLDERGWQVARSAAGGETGLNWWTGANQQRKDRDQNEPERRRSLPAQGHPKFEVLNEVLNYD